MFEIGIGHFHQFYPDVKVLTQVVVEAGRVPVQLDDLGVDHCDLSL